ncbi:ATP-dependent RNA helicase SUB2, partial [Tothia fuscella]
RPNLAINYDLPEDDDSYLYRLGRGHRFGTKGLSISFVSTTEDEEVLQVIDKRFDVAFLEVPLEGVVDSLLFQPPVNLIF